MSARLLVFRKLLFRTEQSYTDYDLRGRAFDYQQEVASVFPGLRHLRSAEMCWHYKSEQDGIYAIGELCLTRQLPLPLDGSDNRHGYKNSLLEEMDAILASASETQQYLDLKNFYSTSETDQGAGFVGQTTLSDIKLDAMWKETPGRRRVYSVFNRQQEIDFPDMPANKIFSSPEWISGSVIHVSRDAIRLASIRCEEEAPSSRPSPRMRGSRLVRITRRAFESELTHAALQAAHEGKRIRVNVFVEQDPVSHRVFQYLLREQDLEVISQ